MVTGSQSSFCGSISSGDALESQKVVGEMVFTHELSHLQQDEQLDSSILQHEIIILYSMKITNFQLKNITYKPIKSSCSRQLTVKNIISNPRWQSLPQTPEEEPGAELL
ncbi:hypothetical protein R6Q59_006169 [Mikania micrantha]